MKFETKAEILWQEADNSEYFTNIRPKCDLCGCESDRVIEYTDDKDSIRACFPKGCFREALIIIFGQNPDLDGVYGRAIIYKPVGKSHPLSIKKEIENTKLNDSEPKYTLRQLRGAWAAGKYSNEP